MTVAWRTAVLLAARRPAPHPALSPQGRGVADGLVARHEYDPYGRIMTQAGFYAAANPFRWSTKRFDPETGSPQRISPQADLSDFGRRYYSATLGRWLNRDPLGDLGGANVYAYVGNNPTNRSDCPAPAGKAARRGDVS